MHSTALQGYEKRKVSGKLGKMRSATKPTAPLSLFVSLVSSGLDPLQPKAQPVQSESTPGEGRWLGLEQQKRGLLAATALAAETQGASNPEGREPSSEIRDYGTPRRNPNGSPPLSALPSTALGHRTQRTAEDRKAQLSGQESQRGAQENHEILGRAWRGRGLGK